MNAARTAHEPPVAANATRMVVEGSDGRTRVRAPNDRSEAEDRVGLLVGSRAAAM